MSNVLARRRDERGYVAIVVAALLGSLFLVLAAIGVDVARWYVEVERTQKAADAAALAGVTYMPNDFAGARAAALKVAALNGYDNATGNTVTVSPGDQPSQLRVSITSDVANNFGKAIGIATTAIGRSSLADYTAPAPMGSPCNTFGNEPASPGGSALPAGAAANCTAAPQFWGAIEGPSTDKVEGDRFMTVACRGTGNAGAVYNCSNGKNTEARSHGYFFAVHVEPGAVGHPMDVQIYDPAYVWTQIDCSTLPKANALGSVANPYAYNNATPDASSRYASNGSSYKSYCSGDYNPSVGSPDANSPTTSFALREQTITSNPLDAEIIDDCNKQFVGQTAAPTADELTAKTSAGADNPNYNPQKAQTFHAWYTLCQVTPAHPGDYYLQVRTNVKPGGTPKTNVNAANKVKSTLIYEKNDKMKDRAGDSNAGIGLNAFSIRAVPVDASVRDEVAVSGFGDMPILQNASGSTATFNLIRALPSTRGQVIAFDFYDAADAAAGTSGSVTIVAPSDATGSIKTSTTISGCQHAMNNNSGRQPSPNCMVSVKNTTNDGQLDHMAVPIPQDYDCDDSVLTGCWFQVNVKFPGNVTDFTTWSANIAGDPVRLTE